MDLETAHTWVCTHTEFTAAFPAGIMPDSAIVEAIREFDKDYVPILCRKVYKTPTGGDVAFGYHIIARFIDCPDWPRDPLRLTGTSTWLTGKDSTRIYEQRMWAGLPKPGTQAARECWPPLFWPHDWALHGWMQANHKAYFGEIESIKSQVLRRLRELKDAEKRELEFIEAEALYSLKSDRRLIRNAIDKELFGPDPVPGPKVMTQAEKDFGAPEAKTATQGAA